MKRIRIIGVCVALIGSAVLAMGALQFHYWSKLSSGSVFSPEFPRPVVVLFNWAFGSGARPER